MFLDSSQTSQQQLVVTTSGTDERFMESVPRVKIRLSTWQTAPGSGTSTQTDRAEATTQGDQTH